MNYFDFLGNLSPILAYCTIFAILFAESGLLVGFFLLGDTLIFPLGLLASQGHFSLPVLFIVCVLGAVTGDSFGYAVGRRFGPSLFIRNDSLLFKKEYVHKAEAYFAHYGKKTIMLARFIPILRTFAPTVAGIAQMEYLTFFLYNLLGGIAWTVSLLILGYFLGTLVPNIDRYLVPFVVVTLLISFISPIKHLVAHAFTRKEVS